MGDRIKSLTRDGFAHYENAAYEEALSAFFETVRLCKEDGNIIGEANQLMIVADIYCATGQPDKALDSYRSVYNLLASIDDCAGMAAVQNNIGLLLSRMQLYEEAMTAFDDARNKFEACGLPERVADQLGNMGSVCRDSENYVTALDFYRQALRRFEQMKLPVKIADQYANIGYIYVLQENKDAALESFAKAETLYRHNGEKQKAHQTLQNIQALRG